MKKEAEEKLIGRLPALTGTANYTEGSGLAHLGWHFPYPTFGKAWFGGEPPS
jgi:hypothetical protein